MTLVIVVLLALVGLAALVGAILMITRPGSCTVGRGLSAGIFGGLAVLSIAAALGAVFGVAAR